MRLSRVTSNDFIEEVVFAEDGVHEHSEVGVGGVVAVEVDASGFFE